MIPFIVTFLNVSPRLVSCTAGGRRGTAAERVTAVSPARESVPRSVGSVASAASKERQAIRSAVKRVFGCTVEPPNKGHFGANSFVPCGEVVPISEVK